jgi:hypothetical protein
MVEELPAQSADDLVADRVGSRRLRWARENPDAFRLEYSVEGAGEPVGFQSLAAALDLGFYAAPLVFFDEAAEDGPALDLLQGAVGNKVVGPGRVELAAAMG